MSVENLLREAVAQALMGSESFLYYTFQTRSGIVAFYAQVMPEAEIIACKEVCIYALSDPPGIKKSTITKELRAEWRAMQQAGQKLGYKEVTFQAERTLGSSSAKPGKVVNIRRRRKP
ncbi:MAG TPA: hypothetical protein VFX55_09840 [Duganella sp.]|nr:hypothetical protein [Duganella sp.]